MSPDALNQPMEVSDGDALSPEISPALVAASAAAWRHARFSLAYAGIRRACGVRPTSAYARCHGFECQWTRLGVRVLTAIMHAQISLPAIAAACFLMITSVVLEFRHPLVP